MTPEWDDLPADTKARLTAIMDQLTASFTDGFDGPQANVIGKLPVCPDYVPKEWG